MRYKKIQVTPTMLAMLFSQGEIHVNCIVGLPKDAKFCYIYLDNTYMLNFVFVSDSWGELKDGEIIPDLQLVFNKL